MDDVEIANLHRLSIGASRETWSFDAVAGSLRQPLIMQRARAGAVQIGLGPAEAAIMGEARAGGVSVPEVVLSGTGGNPLERDFTIVRRIEGESIPRRILRDARLDSARQTFVADCARELAAIHALDGSEWHDVLPAVGDPVEFQRLTYESFDDPHPVFDLVYRWLAANRPTDLLSCVVHGDFRLGNLLVDESGLAAVLDWELCHIGDPRSDLGWLCARAWRFGGTGEVAGIGSKAELLESYEAAGGRSFDATELRWWEILATLRWGNACLVLVDDFRCGRTRSIEMAMVGRRIAEVEYDALSLLPELVS